MRYNVAIERCTKLEEEVIWIFLLNNFLFSWLIKFTGFLLVQHQNNLRFDFVSDIKTSFLLFNLKFKIINFLF